MRIDGPRNLEPTAQLSGSFSGSFLGEFSGNNASLTGSFDGTFNGIGSGSFSGSFQGDGSELDNVFRKVVVAPNNVQSILSAQNSNTIIFTSQSGAGLRITQEQNQSDPEIVFDLVNIPNSSLANSTISGIELGQEFQHLSAGTGLRFNNGSGTQYWDGSEDRELQFHPGEFTGVAATLSTNDKMLISDSGAPKVIQIKDYLNAVAGRSLVTSSIDEKLTLDSTIQVQSILNSNGITIGQSDLNKIIFQAANDSIQFHSQGSMRMQILGSNVDLLGANLDGTAGSNLSDFKLVSANSASFGQIQGQWRGTPGSDDTQRGNWIRGVPHCFTGERNNNVSTTFKRFAFGNGATVPEGPVMPFDGKVIAVTIGWTDALITNGGSDVTQLRFECVKNGVLQGTSASDGNLTLGGAAINASGGAVNSQVNVSFSAGDRINWELAAADPSVSSADIENVLILSFWVIYE